MDNTRDMTAGRPGRLLFSFALPEQTLNRLSAITEQYIFCQLEKTFSTLDFYHTLL